jgi:hypothetical protein
MSFAYRVYRGGQVCAVGAGYESRTEAEDEARPLLREPGDYADITQNTKIIGRIEYGTDRK